MDAEVNLNNQAGVNELALGNSNEKGGMNHEDG